MFSISKNKRIQDLEAEIEKSHAKSRDVIANVSHELRTPVTALLAVTENLCDGVTKWSPAVGKQLLEYAEKLSDTVSFMLDLSRIDSKTQQLNKETVDATDFIDRCVQEAKLTDASKDIQFIVESDDGEMINIDEKRFSAAIVNLLNNAIRFSPRDSEIIIEIFHENAESIINIFDQGPGIDKEKQSEVFSRFYSSAVSNENAKTGGTGIGLSIVQWICELHGGGVSLLKENKRTNGAAFEIRIPFQSN